VDQSGGNAIARFFHSTSRKTNHCPLRKSLRSIDFHEDPEGFDA
jgi:hypothetical protein